MKKIRSGRMIILLFLIFGMIAIPKNVFAWENIGYNVNRMYWGNANVIQGYGLNTTPTYTQETNFDGSLLLNAPVQDNTGIHLAFARSMYYIIGTNANLVQGHTYLITIGIRRNNPYVVRYVQDRPQYTHNDDLQFLYVGTGNSNILQNEYSVSWKYDQSIGEFGYVDTATIRVKVNSAGTGFIFQFGNTADNNFMYVNTNQGQSLLSIWTASVVDMGGNATDNAIADMTNQLNDINNNIIQGNGKLDNINNGINDLNNTINDTNTTDAKNDISGFFNNFSENSHGLSGVITAPLRFLQTFTTASCSPLKFNLPIVHNEVQLACPRTYYETHFSVFFSLWQLITTGVISYNVCINFYKKIRDLQNPNNDRIEVLNL